MSLEFQVRLAGLLAGGSSDYFLRGEVSPDPPQGVIPLGGVWDGVVLQVPAIRVVCFSGVSLSVAVVCL